MSFCSTGSSSSCCAAWEISDSGLRQGFSIRSVIGAVQHTAPSKNLFVQFSELDVQVFARCSAPNCTQHKLQVQFAAELLIHSPDGETFRNQTITTKQYTAPSKNLFVQFSELDVQVFARCSAPNCTQHKLQVHFAAELLIHSPDGETFRNQTITTKQSN